MNSGTTAALQNYRENGAVWEQNPTRHNDGQINKLFCLLVKETSKVEQFATLTTLYLRKSFDYYYFFVLLKKFPHVNRFFSPQ